MKLPALKEIVEERKGKAIEDLSTSFAKNRLPLEEYERLVEYINKIESERELVVVEKIVAEYNGDDTQRKSAEKITTEEEDDDEVDYFQDQYSSSSNLTILSSRTVTGPVKSGSQFLSLLGSSQIRVRKADLTKQVTRLNVVSILGDNTISIEPGIRVVDNTIPILGSSSLNRKVNKQAFEGDPVLVISGAAILGNISVKPLKEKEGE